MQVSLNLAMIVVSIALIVIVIFQSRSSSAGSMFGGGDSPVYRTRRGVERTIYNATIWLAVAFFVLSILSVLAIRG